jgi:hypothetical protein
LKSDRLKRQKNHRLLLTFPRAVVTEKLEVAKVVSQFVEAAQTAEARGKGFLTFS